MENFKEIAEDCLSGNLQGEFIYSTGGTISSKKLRRSGRKTHPYEFESSIPVLYDCEGYTNLRYSTMDDAKYYIVGFTPSTYMKQEQIKIDIPDGKVPVMEQTEKGVVITWKEKELTYTKLYDEFKNDPEYISSFLSNPSSRAFYKKVEVLRKLTNIRNYFGKPKHFYDGVVIKCVNSYCGVETGQFYFDKPDLDSLHEVVFAKQEHAEQAIKMLGDELKYLFEPW